MLGRSSRGLIQMFACAGIFLGQSSLTWSSLIWAQTLPTSAGLLFKSGDAQQEEMIAQQITLSQRLIVKEETWQLGGVQYIDNCPKGQQAVKGNPAEKLRDSLQGDGYRVNVKDVEPVLEGDPGGYAWFVSKTTPPAPGLRIIVRNTSQEKALGKMPYTDREYDSGIRSQGFVLSTDTKHQSRFLAVNMGLNQFAYEIKRGDQVVESGQFPVEFSQRSQPATRIVWLPKQEIDYPCSE